jgi:threonine dehydratase
VTRPLDIERIRAAAASIDKVFLDTPLISHPALDAALGCTLLAKVETLNPIRSFKGRGTELFAAEEKVRAGDHLVCASAGNFGQGLARAATRRQAQCTVFTACDASPAKIAAMRRLGAAVRLEQADFAAAKEAAQHFAATAGARFVEDGAEPAIAEGAGTIGLEIAAQAPTLEALLVPLGDGALLAGVGAALRDAAPRQRILGVVAEEAPALKLSLEAGRRIETASAATIADGIAVRAPVPGALAMLSGRYDAVVAVGEADILRAMQLLHATLGLVVEPSGAVGVAAILADPACFAGSRIGTVLTGGNLTPQQIRSWLMPEEEGGA